MARDSDIAKDFNQRIHRFQRLLKENQIDGSLIVQKVDIYYFTATDQDAHLWIPVSGEPLLMVRKSIERALDDGALDNIVKLTGFSKLPELIKSHGPSEIGRMGLELDILPANLYLHYKRLFPDTKIIDISALIRKTRMVKTPYELSLIRNASKMADSLYELVPGFIKDSKTEIDLALRVEGYYRSQGHPGIGRTRAFNMEALYGHIMAGPCAAMPSASPGPTGGQGPGPYLSQGPGHCKIRQNEPILVDYTANYDGYVSDQARIFSIGDLGDKFQEAHLVMIEVQDAIALAGKPGTHAKDLYALGLEIVEKAGLSEWFMGYPQPVPFVGHGVGMELDEWPIMGKNSEHVLEESMVMAIEPKCIFPGEGVVGVENMFVVTKNGLEKMNQFPDDIVVI